MNAQRNHDHGSIDYEALVLKHRSIGGRTTVQEISLGAFSTKAEAEGAARGGADGLPWIVVERRIVKVCFGEAAAEDACRE